MAEIGITATSFLPGSLSVAEVRGAILAELKNKQSPKLKELHNKTIRTWDFPPTFKIKFTYAGGEAELQTMIEGTEKEIWKWLWLNYGTSVRHAILSDDWISKTQTNTLLVSHGRGRVRAVDSRYLGAGIEPRNWTDLIAAEMDKTFADDIQSALNRGLDMAEAKGRGQTVVSG